jgi:hypothetical protein
MLIAELEMLHGELIQSKEKYDRLSEVTNFHSEELRKRHQITYYQQAATIYTKN